MQGCLSYGMVELVFEGASCLLACRQICVAWRSFSAIACHSAVPKSLDVVLWLDPRKVHFIA